MFFSLTSNQDTRFDKSYQLTPNNWLNLDAGWSRFTVDGKTTFIKGYSEQFSDIESLAHAVSNNPIPSYKGNFLGFVLDSTIIKITHDIDRASPIYINQETCEVSNLFKLSAFVPVNTLVTIVHNTIRTTHSAPARYSSSNSVLQDIDRILSDKFLWLKNQNKTVKFFFSGGLDTLTCLAYLERYSVPYELVNHDVTFAEGGALWSPDAFINTFRNNLREHWGYKQFHYWEEPTIAVTGACGDEVFMRNPDNAALLLSAIGKNLFIETKEHHYHYKYFLKKKSVLRDLPPVSKSMAKMAVVRKVINDHQHWHLGNTLTFTPFHDTKIIELVLQLPEDQLIQTIVDGYIQKELVKLYDPELLNFLAVQKNSNKHVEEAIAKLIAIAK